MEGNNSSSTRFRWKINNFSGIGAKKLYSDIFDIEGNKWRLIVCPIGSNVDYLSIFLEVSFSATYLPYGWTRYAKFSISVINQARRASTVKKETEHEFTASDHWGFTKMLSLDQLKTSCFGFLVNDSILVEVDIPNVDEALQEPMPVVSQTTIPDAHGAELPPASVNLPTQQSTPIIAPSTFIEEQLEQLLTETNVGSQADTPVNIGTETSKQSEQPTHVPEDTQGTQTKTNTTQSSLLIVDPPRVHPPQEPTQEEAAVGSSSFAEFDTLFSDIYQNLLEGKTSEKEALSCSQHSLPSLEEVSHAKEVLKEFFSVNFGNVMRKRRKLELKNALSTIRHLFLDTEKMAVEVTKFVTDFDQNCKQYVGAKEDLEEAKEKENSVGELKENLKQLYYEFIPVRDRAEEVEQEIAYLERQLGERKAKRARIKNDLEGLAARAITSKQALIDAEQMTKLFMPNEEVAKKTINDIEKSWESFKFLSSHVFQ
ncbi:hypothetical protein UlMin_025257 [Ulmus minor]